MAMAARGCGSEVTEVEAGDWPKTGGSGDLMQDGVADDRVVTDRLGSSSHRLAEKPASRMAGRLHNRFPIQKPRLSLSHTGSRSACMLAPAQFAARWTNHHQPHLS